jgi:twitching motility protein PilT
LDTAREPDVNKLLRLARKYGAFVLSLEVGAPPMVLLHGEIRPMAMRSISRDDMQRLLFPIMRDPQRKSLDETGVVTFPHVIGAGEDTFACTIRSAGGRLSLRACVLEGGEKRER